MVTFCTEKGMQGLYGFERVKKPVSRIEGSLRRGAKTSPEKLGMMLACKDQRSMVV